LSTALPPFSNDPPAKILTQTRRLAAILDAGVAGYSRLIEADKEGTSRRCERSAEASAISR
jgi:hypothetical protein